jgi:hypothetical protein
MVLAVLLTFAVCFTVQKSLIASAPSLPCRLAWLSWPWLQLFVFCFCVWYSGFHRAPDVTEERRRWREVFEEFRTHLAHDTTMGSVGRADSSGRSASEHADSSKA